MVQENWLLHESVFVEQPIGLPRLSIESVSFLLNFGIACLFLPVAIAPVSNVEVTNALAVDLSLVNGLVLPVQGLADVEDLVSLAEV